MRIITPILFGITYLNCDSIIMKILAILLIYTALYFLLHFINEIYINKKFFNENIISINNFRKFLSF
jgi:hypothetical protein